MLSIVESIQPVINRSHSVRVNHEALSRFVKNIQEEDLDGSDFAEEALLTNASEDEQIAFSILCNTLHFSYWGNPKWAISIEEKAYDGSIALVYALRRAIEQNIPLLSPEYLAHLPEERFAKILKGSVEIPLFQERLSMLRELGRTVLEKYGGSFTNILRRADGNAERIVEHLVRDFPAVFNDVARYQGHEVRFYKRAQLIAAHFFDLRHLGILSIPLSGYDSLTAFADYKIPQLLRKFGILEYVDELAMKIDHLVEIPSGSDEEIEIRANTIWAVQCAADELQKRLPKANAARIDHILWTKGQRKTADDKPYHHTRTIWY